MAYEGPTGFSLVSRAPYVEYQDSPFLRRGGLRHPFLSGLAQSFDMGGVYRDRGCGNPWAEDAFAIASDWWATGWDIRGAIDNFSW